VLSLPQLSGVVILHLLLRGLVAGADKETPGFTMCGGGTGTVLRCWAIAGVAASATETTNETGNSKLFIEHVHWNTSSLKQARFQVWSASVEHTANLSSPGDAPISRW